MAFNASNGRVWLNDTNGDLVFDTNRDMPHILGVYQGTVSNDFTTQYYNETYITLTTLPPETNFIVSRAVCTPYNLSTGLAEGGVESFPKYGNMPWNSLDAGAAQFFQGSLELESGITGLRLPGRTDSFEYNTYARRILHVYPESWGLVAMFQQSTRSGWGAIPASAQVRWTVDLKVWYGRFR